MQAQTIKLNISSQALYKTHFAGRPDEERLSAAIEMTELVNAAFAHYYTTKAFANLPDNKKLAVSFVNESILALNLGFVSNSDGADEDCADLEIPYCLHSSLDSTYEYLQANKIITRVISSYLSSSHAMGSNYDQEDENLYMTLDFYQDILMQCWLQNPTVQHKLHQTLKPSQFNSGPGHSVEGDNTAENGDDVSPLS